MPHTPRSQQLYDHAIKFVTPFSTTLGHAWVIVPNGPTRHHGWPIFSRRFRSWLASTFHNEHGLFPGCHAIDSALTLLAAHASYSQFPSGEIATRIGWLGDPCRPESVLLHLANANDELIEITPDAHRVITVEDLNRRASRLPTPDSRLLPPTSSSNRPPPHSPNPPTPPHLCSTNSATSSASPAPPSPGPPSGSSPPSAPPDPTPFSSSPALAPPANPR
jgi:hypothetical protein